MHCILCIVYVLWARILCGVFFIAGVLAFIFPVAGVFLITEYFVGFFIRAGVLGWVFLILVSYFGRVVADGIPCVWKMCWPCCFQPYFLSQHWQETLLQLRFSVESWLRYFCGALWILIFGWSLGLGLAQSSICLRDCPWSWWHPHLSHVLGLVE